MPICGKLIVLKATGEDGSNFPLAKEICKFGTSETCDIRVLLPNVGKEHCQIDCEPNGRVFLINLTEDNVTFVNGAVIKAKTELRHGDVIKISDRQFRLDPPDLSRRRSSSVASRRSSRDESSEKRRSRSVSPGKSASKAKRRSSAKLNLSTAAEVPETPMAPSTISDKRKSVTFGSALSPELFDTKLPPATPVKKGAQPARKSLGFQRKPSLKVNQRRSGSPKRKSLSPRVNVADVKKAPLPQSARKASPLKQSRLPIKISSKPPVHFGLASKNLKTPTNATSKRVENSRIPISLGKRPVSTQKFANQPFSNSSKKGTPTQLVNSAKMVPLSPNLGKLTTPTISTIAKRRVSITPQQSVAKVKTWASVVKVSRPDYTTKVKTPKLVKTPAKLPMGNMKVSCGSRWDRNALVEKVPDEKISHTGHILSPETIVIRKSSVTNGSSTAPYATPMSSPASTSEMSLSTPADPSHMILSPMDSPRLAGIRQLLKSPQLRQSVSPKLAGVKTLFPSPSTSATGTPKLAGIKDLLKTPADKSAEISLNGLRELVKTPKNQAETILAGIRELVKSPTAHISPVLVGVREMLRSPKTPTDAMLTGIRELLNPVKSPKSPELEGLAEMFRTPPNQHFSPAEPQSPVHSHIKRKTPGVRGKVAKLQMPMELASVTRSSRRGKVVDTVHVEPKSAEKVQLTRSPRKPQKTDKEDISESSSTSKTPGKTRSPRKLKAVSVQKTPEVTRTRSPRKAVKGEMVQKKSPKQQTLVNEKPKTTKKTVKPTPKSPEKTDVKSRSPRKLIKLRTVNLPVKLASPDKTVEKQESPDKPSRGRSPRKAVKSSELAKPKSPRKTRTGAKKLHEDEIIVISPAKRSRKTDVEKPKTTRGQKKFATEPTESPMKKTKRLPKSTEISSPNITEKSKSPVKKRKVDEKPLTPEKATSRKRKPTENEDVEVVKQVSPVKRGRKGIDKKTSPAKTTRTRQTAVKDSPIKKLKNPRKSAVTETVDDNKSHPVAVVKPLTSRQTRSKK